MSIDIDAIATEVAEDTASTLKDVLTRAIGAHMRAQPYTVECADCGEELTVDCVVDRENDLRIRISPCEDCRQEAIAEFERATTQ